MTVAQSWPLQQAVFSRLVEALAGQGIGGAAVPVFDHVPPKPPRLHVRIDGFFILPGDVKSRRRAQHRFIVHVFDDQTGDDTGAGREQVARLQPIVVAALEHWSPFPGATAIEHVSSESAPDEDPAMQHGLSRFRTYIGE